MTSVERLDVVRRQVARAARLGIRKRRRRPLRPLRWLHPTTQARSYARLLLVFVGRISDEISRMLIAALPGLHAEASATRLDSAAVIADAWPDRLEDLVERLRIRIAPDVETTARTVRAVGHAVSNKNAAEFAKIVRHAIGVDVFVPEPWLADTLESFAKENARLITSIPDELLTKVETLVQRGLRAGTRHEELAEDVRDQLGVTKSRAKLIARDQVSKLNAHLTQTRQRGAGIDEYTWRTSLDERVRPSHREKEGEVFRWDSPPADTGHPGEDVNCRCIAEPVLDGLLEEVA